MKQICLLITILFTWATSGQAQNERKFVRQGNKYFEAAMKDTSRLDTVLFNKAEIEYRKALDKKQDNAKWNFNLGDALYKQNKFDESADQFKETADKTSNKIEKSQALHNMGNSMLMNKKLDESIAAYKEALRNNPKDMDTKYNLLYAMNMKKKQEDQKKKQDKDKDKNKDQDKKDQDKKDQNKDQDQKNKDQQKQNQQQQQNKISKQDAEQMLQALENSEKKIQDKVKKVQALKAQSKKVDKDW